MLTQINAPFEVKAENGCGEFSGYASIFNNKDLGDDIVMPGAFKEVKSTSDGMLRIALYHDLTQIIAKAKYSQDEKGLFVEGKINNASYSQDAYELMKDGSLDGMSVGFTIMKDGSEFREQEDGVVVRVISKACLYEASVVPFGMNPEAKVENVKNMDGVILTRKTESFLRNLGFTRRDAVAKASPVVQALLSDSEATHDLLSDSKSITREQVDALFAN